MHLFNGMNRLRITAVLSSLALIHCAATITRPLDIRDPSAYASTMKDLKSRDKVHVVMQDGAEYSGKISSAGEDTIGFLTMNAYSRIPLSRISGIGVMDHGIGSVHGLTLGLL